MARYDDLNTGPIAYAAFVSSVLLLVIILLVRALCYSWVEAEDEKKLAAAHYSSADSEIVAQKARISRYGKQSVVVAPPEGQAPEGGEPMEVQRLVIPVERAKDMLLKDLKAEPNA